MDRQTRGARKSFRTDPAARPSSGHRPTRAPARARREKREKPGAGHEPSNDLVCQHPTREPEGRVDDLVGDRASRSRLCPTEKIRELVEDARVGAQRIGVVEEAVPPRLPFAHEGKHRLVAEAASGARTAPRGLSTRPTNAVNTIVRSELTSDAIRATERLAGGRAAWSVAEGACSLKCDLQHSSTGRRAAARRPAAQTMVVGHPVVVAAEHPRKTLHSPRNRHSTSLPLSRARPTIATRATALYCPLTMEALFRPLACRRVDLLLGHDDERLSYAWRRSRMRGAVTAPVVSALVLALPPSPTIVLGAGAGASDAGDGYCGVRGPVENRGGYGLRVDRRQPARPPRSQTPAAGTPGSARRAPAMWASGTRLASASSIANAWVIGSEEQLVDAGRRRATCGERFRVHLDQERRTGERCSTCAAPANAATSPPSISSLMASTREIPCCCTKSSIVTISTSLARRLGDT